MTVQPKRCRGLGQKGCSSRNWSRVGVISAQKGTYLFQCERCGRCVIIKGDHIPETENPLADI